MNQLNITINNKPYLVDPGKSILEIAEENNIFIPRLCFLKGIHEEGNCRLCSVKIKANGRLVPSCSTSIQEGMDIITNDQDVYDSVSMNLELIAQRHRFDCYKCSREHNCELLDLLKRYNIDVDINTQYNNVRDYLYQSTDSMVIDSSKCVMCGRCVSACQKQSGLGILNFNHRGSETFVGPALFHDLDDSGCIYCGKCIGACPTGALKEKEDFQDVGVMLRNPNKKVIVQIAPSVRAALGEEFGYPIGTNVEGQMYSAIHELGFDDIMDTNFTADLTILEEGYELLNRIKKGGKLPQFTSCSPGWVNYIEQYYPEYLENLSSCKSPQQMAGALIKTYYAEKLGYKKEDIVSVSIMPCIAKKSEKNRIDMDSSGLQDVDYVITTREFARLIKQAGINFRELESMSPFGELAKWTGAGALFGATGGVMEAALRTVADVLEGQETDIDFSSIRGTTDIKEATYRIKGIDINVAVVHGGSAIKTFMEQLKTSKKEYHFVEFMGCTGGCINGGGQPIVPAKIADHVDVRALRASVLYSIDEHSTVRKSHQNETVKELYDNFLGHPNSVKAHHLLHTHYQKKGVYENVD
jgi:NADP-reducing hydrogenase subunit HndD